ncbi:MULTISPECIES: hypothetical protein [Shinella]|uniref:Major facilitator superfamily (MFS) profile domain-containing protein n=1 Tax=Shinella sedimenti TaxID=2919913 RepID=A0ABT0CJU2_9HYPH|nr:MULTISPECIES: hypothetical protein [Shinella]MCJ8148873.1 hypothetical protein [Shinella sedimenti]
MTADNRLAASGQPSFLLVALGYIAAVLTATTVVIFLLYFWAGASDGLFQIFLVGLAYTLGCALPGFIVTVVLARVLQMRAWLFFVIAGGIDGPLSLVFFDRSLLYDTFVFMILAGGLAGGLAYWLIAYRRTGASA